MDIRRMRFALLSAAWIAGSATPPAAMESLPAAMESLEVTIVVDNLRSARGRIRIALWSEPDGFADADAALVETGQPARPGAVRFTIGLPDEGLGFSNGAWIGFGPPAFDEAAVEIGENDRVIAVSLRY